MTVFFHDNLRLEVGSDVISGVDVEQVGIGIYVKFGDLGHAMLEIYHYLTL